MPQILLPECDVLIVDEIGKNYSGTGMDPNVTGRHVTPYCSGGLRVQRIVVLRMSGKSHCNGYGMERQTAPHRRFTVHWTCGLCISMA